MTGVHRFSLWLGMIPVALGASAGCAGEAYDRARAAERSGDASRAYDEYILAAQDHHGKSVIRAGLSRVRERAAADAESAALSLMDQGRFADAWRMFMRALDIQPSHPDVPQLIRRLERDHPDVIAAARSDWLRRGWDALAYIEPDSPPTRLASAVPSGQEDAPPSGAPALPTIKSASPPAAGALAAPFPATVRPQSSESRRPDAASISSSPPKRQASPAPTSAKADLKKASPSEDGAPPDSADIITHTLSKRDKRYPRIVLAVDGVTVELRDTDGDQEVELDLLIGDERIKKIRDLLPGESRTFRGRSGKLYRLKLLAVHHKSHTVRIAIQPA